MLSGLAGNISAASITLFSSFVIATVAGWSNLLGCSVRVGILVFPPSVPSFEMYLLVIQTSLYDKPSMNANQ